MKKRKIGGPLKQMRFFAVLVSLALLITACSPSVPEGLKLSADSLPKRIEVVQAEVSAAEAKFGEMLRQERYAFLAQYPAKQQRADRFGEAHATLKRATALYENGVKPIIDKYNESRATELRDAITSVMELVKSARELASEPAEWAVKVADTKANPAGVLKRSEEAVTAVSTDFGALQTVATTGKQGFPKQTKQIDGLLAAAEKPRGSTESSLKALQSEAASPQPNYAVMTERADAVLAGLAAYTKQAEGARSKLGELPVRETHTLVDARVDSVVTISRVSWDDYYDWPTENEYEYAAVPVDLETANYFAQFGPEQAVASVTSDGQNFVLLGGMSPEQWAKLKINTTLSWTEGDTHAEFFVGELEDTYCHRLRVLRNGEPDTSKKPDPKTDYCSQYNTQADLTQGFFWAESDELGTEAIGMDVYSKGYGDFADQATDAATPPGMVYVGDPSTGEWQKDEDGNEFWGFYGRYLFYRHLIGGPTPYYTRSEYDRWNNGYRYSNRPYYGTYNGAPRFGGRSPLAASRLPNSTFAKSGLHEATVRNAGPVARAGGPGNGGK